MTILRITSTLPPELDALVQRTIGALLAVHRELGSGMSEGVYAAATRLELSERGIRSKPKKVIQCDIAGSCCAISGSTCSSISSWLSR
jgi:hypothetical protein